MNLDTKPLRDAIAANEAAALPAVGSGAKSTGREDDMISPGGRAAGAVLGYDVEDVNEIARAFADHCTQTMGISFQRIRSDRVAAALVMGMFWGYLARVREEQDSAAEPAEAILRQVIGYLKGKAQCARDEEVNAPTHDARSELNKQATALELAAEALAKEAASSEH